MLKSESPVALLARLAILNTEHLNGDAFMPETNSSTKEIPLTQGKVAIVSLEDYEALAGYKWHFTAQGYARRYCGISGKSSRHITMHREIMRALPAVQVDHIDRDRLNNTRANLRLATSQQNSFNQKARSRQGLQFKGTFLTSSGYYGAHIKFNYQLLHLGVFSTERDAAIAYDIKARELFGEFASLNFPNTANLVHPSFRRNTEPIFQSSLVVQIPLTKGKFATIDAEDLERVILFRWYAVPSGQRWYAERGWWVSGKRQHLRLHNQIINRDTQRFIGFKNRNGLDCRKENLCVVEK